MERSQVEQVRRLNRQLTRRVGALDESYLARGRPLSAARVIFETGSLGGMADLAVLRARLGLDSGYLSRLLRSLEGEGLIEVARGPGDGRTRQAVLTAKGKREFAVYDRLSDRLARSMLEPLSAGRRERLVAAMGEVETLLHAAGAEYCEASPDGPEARRCLDAYFGELARRFEGGFDPRAGGAGGDGGMTPPSGRFLLARIDGEAVGCGGYKRLDAATGEIKRVWVAKAARGLGIATAIMERLEAMARKDGLAVIRLDTNSSLGEARSMYLKSGYREIDRYNDNPFAHHWFEKEL